MRNGADVTVSAAVLDELMMRSMNDGKPLAGHKNQHQQQSGKGNSCRFHDPTSNTIAGS